MVAGTINKQAAILGRVPAHVKFTVETVLPSGVLLELHSPRQKAQEKGLSANFSQSN